MKYTSKILREYVSKGLIVGQKHPTLPLAIFNYSRECQYQGMWDDFTLNCRGLILDKDGNVVAKGFPKFFNYEEHIAEGSKLPAIPNEDFEVYEKLDGSLGIIFYYEEQLSDERRYNIWFENNYETGMERFFDPNNLPDFDDPYYEPTPKTIGGWHIASKGSFTSEQAIKGKELLDKMDVNNSLIPGYTYLVEIIYPQNRIVVDYGNQEKLVMLACYHTKSGKEADISEMNNEGWEVVKRYKIDGDDWKTIKKEISKDKEGYVIRFKSGFRMKIKGEEYIRLHRILTNISTRVIWKMLVNKEPMEPILEKVPDEFDKWFKEVVKDLQTRFDNINKDYFNIFIEITNKVLSTDRKQFAEEASRYQHPAILFAIYDGKIEMKEEYIWKILKPKYEKAFKIEE